MSQRSSIGDDGWSVISTTTAGKSLLSNVKIDSYSRMYLYQTIPSTQYIKLLVASDTNSLVLWESYEDFVGLLRTWD